MCRRLLPLSWYRILCYSIPHVQRIFCHICFRTCVIENMSERPDAKHPIKETKAAAMERKEPKETKGKNTPCSAGWKASFKPHFLFIAQCYFFLFSCFLLLFPRKKSMAIFTTSVQSKQPKKSKASVVQLPPANCFKQS